MCSLAKEGVNTEMGEHQRSLPTTEDSTLLASSELSHSHAPWLDSLCLSVSLFLCLSVSLSLSVLYIYFKLS